VRLHTSSEAPGNLATIYRRGASATIWAARWLSFSTEVVARPEEDAPRRVSFHADRAEDAVLQRLLLTLDLDERAAGRVCRGLERLEAGRGRRVVARAFGRRPVRLRARVHVEDGDAREAVELLLDAKSWSRAIERKGPCLYVCTDGSRRACGIGACARLLPTKSDPRETSGPRIDRIPSTRPSS
jgi:hypothetical protein